MLCALKVISNESSSSLDFQYENRFSSFLNLLEQTMRHRYLTFVVWRAIDNISWRWTLVISFQRKPICQMFKIETFEILYLGDNLLEIVKSFLIEKNTLIWQSFRTKITYVCLCVEKMVINLFIFITFGHQEIVAQIWGKWNVHLIPAIAGGIRISYIWNYDRDFWLDKSRFLNESNWIWENRWLRKEWLIC